MYLYLYMSGTEINFFKTKQKQNKKTSTENKWSVLTRFIFLGEFSGTVKLGIKELLNKELLALRNFLLITNSFIP